MSVTLRKRKNSDDSVSLLLDIYNNGTRRYEFLKNLKLVKPANPADRQANKDNLNLANKIAVKRAQELSANDYTMITDTGKKTDIVEWMQSFIDTYKKKDKRNMQGALNRFKDFLIEDKKQGLTFGRLTELVISDFQDYLRQHSTGEGASSYFNRFKKMVKQAYRQKLLLNNPATEVKTVQGNAKKKDTLTLEEIQLLSTTSTESSEVKRAFLFSCVTGLRWIDVTSLKWSNINIKGRYMTVQQSKTEKEVTINLNDTAIKLLNKAGKPDSMVFTLPTANGANKSLKAWVKRAGIEKKITWHNARHSFGTNLIFHGADVTTASSLLGHSTLKHTQRYVKAASELKERATDKLNIEI
jgi:integrase/recombinase XerD